MSPAYFSFHSICAFQYVYFGNSYALVFSLNLSLTEFRNGRKSAYFHEIAELDRTESLKMVYISILIRHHYREVSTTLFYSHMSHTTIFGGLFNLVDDVRCIYRQCCLLIFKCIIIVVARVWAGRSSRDVTTRHHKSNYIVNGRLLKSDMKTSLLTNPAVAMEIFG